MRIVNQKLPVVFSTNDGYALHCYLAIRSMLKSASRNYRYDVRVLYTSLSQENRKRLESLSNSFAEVSCLDATPYVKDADLRGLSFFTSETFYRLFISSILPQYETILYLDCDMLILRDISELFAINTGERPIAGVRDVLCTYLLDHMKDLQGIDMRNTINAGVLLINTKLFEERNVRDICLRLLVEDYQNKYRKYIYVDQDLLNICCAGDIQFFDDRWNFQYQYLWRRNTILPEYRDRYAMMEKDPWIIHYAGDRKPWAYPLYPFADRYWAEAKEAGILLEDMDQVIRSEREKGRDNLCFQGFRFPYEDVPPGSSVAIYGAGMVGADFSEQLRQTLYAKKTLWVDRNYGDKKPAWNVQSPEQLAVRASDYDYVVIALDDSHIAGQVREYLLNMGVDGQKIVWRRYRRAAYEQS